MNSSIFGTTVRTVGLTVNAPTLFRRPDFMEWLNDPRQSAFTIRAQPEPTASDWSDTIVLVSPDYEGTASDMPADLWRAICDLVYSQYGGPEIPQAMGSQVTVRLTNLEID